MRAALLGVVLAGALGFAATQTHGDHGGGGRADMGPWLAMSLAEPYDGGWAEFLRIDGYGGTPTACACPASLPVYGSDGGQFSTLHNTTTSAMTCNRRGSTTWGGVMAPYYSGITPGDYVTCAAGTLRIGPMSHDAGYGIEVENQVQRVLVRSEQFENASWVAICDGGATCASIVGVDSGSPVDPWDGSSAEIVAFAAASATQLSGYRQAALSAAAHTCSIHVQGLAGDAGLLDVCVQTSGLSTCSPCVYNASNWTRCAIRNVTSVGSGQFAFGNLPTWHGDGGSYPAQTVAVFGASCEQSINELEYVTTTSAAVTPTTDTPRFGFDTLATFRQGCVRATFQTLKTGTLTGALFAFGTNGRPPYFSGANVALYDGTNNPTRAHGYGNRLPHWIAGRWSTDGGMSICFSDGGCTHSAFDGQMNDGTDAGTVGQSGAATAIGGFIGDFRLDIDDAMRCTR